MKETLLTKLQREARENSVWKIINIRLPPEAWELFWKQQDTLIAHTLKQATEALEGIKTKDTDGKTYHAQHPDVIRDQVLTDAQRFLLGEDND